MTTSVPFVLATCDGGCGTRKAVDLVPFGGTDKMERVFMLTEPVDVTLSRAGWTVEPSGLGGKKDVLHLCPSCAPKKMPTVADVIKSHQDPHHIPTWKECGVDNADAHGQALDAKKVRGVVKTSRSRRGKRHAVMYYLFTDRAGRDHKLHPTIVCTGKKAPSHRTIINGNDDMITCRTCRRDLGLTTVEVEYLCLDGHTTTHTMEIDNVLKTVVCNHQFAAEGKEGGTVARTCMKDAVRRGE